MGGDGKDGLLGNGSVLPQPTPIQVSLASTISVTNLTVGQYHSCVQATNGRAYCWGINNRGQLGDNSTANRSSPVAVLRGQMPTVNGIAHLAVGVNHTCAIATNGRAYCWGLNESGQLGRGTNLNDASLPQAVAVGTGSAIPATGVRLTHIAAGLKHTCAVGSNNQVYCWE